MDDYVEVYSDSAGEHRWRFKAANGQTLADGGEGYKSRGDLLTAVRKVTGRTPAIVETKGAPTPGAGMIRVVMHRG